jgi:hypothetical protein
MCAMSRRDFAKLAALGGAASLVPMLRGSRALGGVEPIPKRVVFVYFADGLLWGEGDFGRSTGAGYHTSFDLPRAFAPLEHLRSRTIYLENLDMRSLTDPAGSDPTRAKNAHSEAETHALACVNRFPDETGERPGGITIDQLIARELNSAGPVTALPSLEIACRTGASRDPEPMLASATGPGAVVSMLSMPDVIFDRCFPPGTDAPMSSTALSRQNRIFSFLRGQGSSTVARLAREDRAKIEEHMSLQSDLELRRRLFLSGGDRRALWPSRSMLAPAEGLDWSYNASEEQWRERHEVATPIKLDTVAAALHADVTRVATILLEPYAQPPGFEPIPGDMVFGDMHALQHATNGNPTVAADPVARGFVRSYLQSGMAHVAHLADRLAELTEVDGSSLLDHTLIVFTSQIAYGDHQVLQLPWFTIGNIDGYLRTGGLVRLPRTGEREASRFPGDLPGDYRARLDVDGHAYTALYGDGRSHGDLYVTVANAMGIPITTFGKPEISAGPIAEMLA